MTPLTKIAILLVGAAVAAPLIMRSRLHEHEAHPAPSVGASQPAPARTIHVPRATAPFVLNGELTEPAWHSTPVTRFLGPDGSDGRPYSEVRFLWSPDGILHVGLYASDKNIVSAGVGDDGPVWRGDSFHVVFSKDDAQQSFDIGPTAHGVVLTDGQRHTKGAWDYKWQSGAHVALDMDEGTVDDPGHADEEWVVELEVPLASIGLRPEAGQKIDFSARRCDLDSRGGRPLESPCPAIALGLTLDP